jgi:hypothetical protein
VARDQEVDIPTQLGLGVRFLQSQAHECVYNVVSCLTLTNDKICTYFLGKTESYISVIQVRVLQRAWSLASLNEL